MTDERSNILSLDEIGEEPEEFAREFPLRTLDGQETGKFVEVHLRAPSVSEAKAFTKKRQGVITSKGRLKKAPNEIEIAIEAIKACVPHLRKWTTTDCGT